MGWENLANEAERELNRAVKRVKDLRAAIRIFRANAANGTFFPGTDKHEQGD